MEYKDKQTRYIKVRDALQQQIKDGKTITITEKELKKHADGTKWDYMATARAYVADLLEEALGEPVALQIGEGTITAYLTREGINHFTKYVAPEKAAAPTKFFDIIRNSRYAYSSNTDNHGRSSAKLWDYFVCPMNIDGQDATVPFLLTVRQIDRDARMQIYGMGYNPYTKKNTEAAIPHGGGSQEDAMRRPDYRESTASSVMVADESSAVKSETITTPDGTTLNNDIGASDAEVEAEANEKLSREVDLDTLAMLNNQELVTVYRAMQVVDGKLYPPMAAKVSEDGGQARWVEPTEIGVWYRSDERPELIDAKGKFKLDKGNGKSLTAAYNPYFHTSNMMLNDQFSSAWDRDNLVVVEASIPEVS